METVRQGDGETRRQGDAEMTLYLSTCLLFYPFTFSHNL